MANTTNWLNISATSGSSGETILTLSANKNLSLYDKRAEITAYNPVYNISAKTYVTIQSFAPIIELSPAIIGVPDTGGTFELNISANCAWVISFPDLVSSYSTSAGTGNATVTLTVPGTSADTTLVGNIVATAEGGQMSKTARIEQYGQGVQLSVSHSEILFPDSGAVRYFTVTANCVYDVSVVSGDWAVVSPQSGYTGVSSFTVTVDGTNTGTTTREGIVRISAPGVTRYIMLYQNPKETRLTAYYNATSTTNPTELYEVGTGFSKAETPDGTVIPGDSYIFPDTGSNRVFYTMTGTNIPANTFSGMSALTSVVIPDNITTIGQGAFRDCVNLTSVTIPDTVTVLPDNCFNGCSSLTAIPISESVTYIGEGCFAGCTGIETVTIPTGVTGIGAGCFSGSGVETIYANSPTPATIGNGAFTSGNLRDIIVPCAFFDAYKTAWSAYEEYMSCQDDEQLYFTTDTSNVKGTGETRTITILNTNIIQNRIGLTLPSDFPSQGSYVVDGNVIYLTYPANPSSTSTRTWTITVRATTKSGKDLSGSYRITQNANVVYTIPYTADTSTVAATGETRTITIDTSNLDPSTISIGIEGATGVTYTYDNGLITVTFPENAGSSASGQRNVIVTVTGKTTDRNNAYANITYTQNYNYTGETRVFIVYRQSYNTPTKISYEKSWTKVELADGTDITADIKGKAGGQGEGGEWIQSGYGYDFGQDGFYGVYLTIPGKNIGSHSFSTCYNIMLVDIPNNFEIIFDEAFSPISSPTIISLGESLTYFGRKVFFESSIGKLLFKSQIAPTIYPGIEDSYSNLFYNINSGGTLFYPCGSNYSTYESVLEGEHSWSSACISETGSPVSSYTYSAYILGNLQPFKGEGETRTFKVGCLSDTGNTFSYSVSGPNGTTYTYTGDSITVTVPKNESSSLRDVTISVTATSFNGALVGTGEITVAQILDESVWTVATYKVTSTTTPTKILGYGNISGRIYARFPDGSERALEMGETGYTFQSAGVQTIKYQMLLTASTLDGSMFDSVPNLLSVSVSTAITHITNGCFCRCDSLSAVSIPNSVTAISYDSESYYGGQQCFVDCPSLLSIVIPDSVAYVSCYGPEGSIKNNNCVFCYNCPSLSSVTIGSGISPSNSFTSPFSHCGSLTEIYMRPSIAPRLSSDAILGTPSGTLYYPSGSDYEWWLEVLGWTGSPTL